MRTSVKLLCTVFCVATLFSATGLSAQNKEKSVMVTNGIKFLGTPYKAGTLDINDEEELILNCDEMDCTTFVEYVLALSLSPTEDGQVAEGDFAGNLQKIRYRDGIIDGYTSRLHYMTDWIENGVQNGFLEDVTTEYSPYAKKISVSYMTSHPNQYRQLANSPENVAAMKKIEKALSQKEIRYVPTELLPIKGLPWIKNGDIIAIVSSKPGLDIAHMGIAFYVDGKLSLLHASSSEKKVAVSKVALSQMLKSNDKWIGIRVVRMKK